MMNEVPGLDIDYLKLHGFKVHQLPGKVNIPVSSGLRDLYKMGLADGDMPVRYGDRVVDLDQPALFFVAPEYHMPCYGGLKERQAMPALLPQI